MVRDSKHKTSKIAKVCVLCGGKLANKTTEHVLPRCLIEMTGDPKRKATFDLMQSENGKAVRREFFFDSFKFPACKSCN